MQKAISKYWPVFVLPTLLAFIIGFIWPFIWGIYLSFQRFTTVSKTTFVGLQNYINVFSDETFLHAFSFTAAFTVVSTVLINVCAFAIALVLTRGIRGTNIFRTVYFMPNLIGGILLGYIWQILLNGVLANLQRPLLALDAKAGFVGLVILMCWQQIGYMMIIYVAGLQSVPGDLIEAAKIDGANDREILFKIKIPMVMPSVTICTFLTLTNSFKLFDQNVALTAGEPANASEMLALNIYNTFYGRSGAQWKGIGQAKAAVFFLIVVVISLIQLKFTRSQGGAAVMPKDKKMWDNILTVIMSLLCLLWIYPIVLILQNSLKLKAPSPLPPSSSCLRLRPSRASATTSTASPRWAFCPALATASSSPCPAWPSSCCAAP